jgi:amidase/6-aminohexanoate-cyclic-dimer hydrolase
MTDRRDVLGMMAASALLPAAAVAASATRVARTSALDELFERHDGLGMAELVRRREVSAAELLEAAIARCDAVAGTLNAVPLRHDAEARAQLAALPAGAPFAGVPFLLKDLNVALAGTVTSNGSRFFRDARHAEDSEIVRRYRAAGLVIFGKTSSPELGLTGTAESVLHGATRNPWNLDRIVGGSSGGAGAVVAARVVPIAHASDGAGSIRTPASCCGVFGLKPSRGRVPLGPARLEGWNGLSTQHAVSLSVRDNAALLDATAGPETGSPYLAPPSARPWLSEVGADPGRLRVALVETPLGGTPVDPVVQAALLDTARLLESLGHRVEPARLPVDHTATNAAMLATLGVSTLLAVREREQALGRAAGPDDLEPITAWFAEIGRGIDGLGYARARQAFDAAGRAMARFHERHDVVLSPTLAKPPLPLGVIGLSPRDRDAFVREIVEFGPFAAVANMTGQPAMSVPLAWTGDGLPMGMMFAAALGNEALLYRLAGQLEQARPWRGRRPPQAVPLRPAGAA